MGRNVLTFRSRRSGFVSHSMASVLSLPPDVTAVSLGLVVGIPQRGGGGGGIPRGTRMLELTADTGGGGGGCRTWLL